MCSNHKAKYCFFCGIKLEHARQFSSCPCLYNQSDKNKKKNISNGLLNGNDLAVVTLNKQETNQLLKMLFGFLLFWTYATFQVRSFKKIFVTIDYEKA